MDHPPVVWRSGPLELHLDADSLGFRRIRRAGGADFARCDGGAPPLWEVEVHAGTDVRRVSSDRAGESRLSEAGGVLSAEWPAVPLPGEPAALTVSVRCSPGGDGDSLWDIEVRNRSDRYGVWEVDVPVVRGLRPGAFAIPRGNGGRTYAPAAEPQRLEGRYPSADWPAALLVQAGGLLIAALDPEAWPKRFQLETGRQVRIVTPAPEAGRPGAGYRSPGPVALGLCAEAPGRLWWLPAARRFRTWALRQPWAVAARPHPRLAAVDLWMRAGGEVASVVGDMRRAAAFFGQPLGLHWYNWHSVAFDTCYPEYFPAREGFAESVAALVGDGHLVMPYINARLWDMALPSFAGAAPHCSRDAMGVPHLEVYPSGARQAVMCPATGFWQDRVAEVVRRLVLEFGCNAVYLDQIASAWARLCFDERHGHPLGGGPHWVSGYRTMLAALRDLPAVLTTENNADPYMGAADGFLTWLERLPDETPLMAAIYGGRTLAFGSPFPLQSSDGEFGAAQARDFLAGTQLGWMEFDLLEPLHRRKAEWLRTLAHCRAAHRDAFVFGELVGTLPGAEDGDGQLLTAVWRRPGGEWAGFAVNPSPERHRLAVRGGPALDLDPFSVATVRAPTGSAGDGPPELGWVAGDVWA